MVVINGPLLWSRGLRVSLENPSSFRLTQNLRFPESDNSSVPPSAEAGAVCGKGEVWATDAPGWEPWVSSSGLGGCCENRLEVQITPRTNAEIPPKPLTFSSPNAMTPVSTERLCYISFSILKVCERQGSLYWCCRPGAKGEPGEPNSRNCPSRLGCGDILAGDREETSGPKRAAIDRGLETRGSRHAVGRGGQLRERPVKIHEPAGIERA